jgi:inosine/xanthosine triphosphatase
MKVIVASRNPIKIDAVKEAFQSFYREVLVEGVDTVSGVSDQPLTEKETLSGARNRAMEAEKMIPQADFWIGIEGGIQAMDNGLFAFAWIVVISGGKTGEARTATFLLPKKVSNLIEGGLELGAANDIVFHQSNSKQKTGAVGLLTHNHINRMELYRQAVVLALIPFINPGLY